MSGSTFNLKIIVRCSIAALLTLVIFGGTLLAGVTLSRPQEAYAVSVDGRLVGYVHSSLDYQELLLRVIQEAREKWGCDLVINEVIQANRVSRRYPVSDEPVLHARIRDTATFATQGYAVVVNGKPAVIMNSLETAAALLAAVKAHYTPATKEVKAVSIIDNIDFQEVSADPADIADWDTALATLLQGGDKTMSYVVRRGDTLGAIARSNNTTIQELRKLNSLSSDSLQVGQVLNLADTSGQIRVRAIYTQGVIASIPFHVEYRTNPDINVREDRVIQAGSNGVREVTWQIELINGQEVRRTELASRVKTQPTSRIIMPGSGPWPERPLTFLRFPMNTGRISPNGLFGTPRGSWLHTGLDIAAPMGTPIYAAADGTVRTRAFDGRGYGWYVIIDHKDGYSTVYAHCSSIPSWVQPGRKVVRGQVIAYVGSTGNSTGPHLHFEVRINGRFVNPRQFFR
jgi:murein DD-endopeptidase MepM/ murein hydrolase activator NlpD